MSKIKSLIPDDFKFEYDNNMSGIAQEIAELDTWIKSDEAQLAGYTTDRLIIEINARTQRDLDKLSEAVKRIYNVVLGEKSPF